jgi:hypothetical protein
MREIEIQRLAKCDQDATMLVFTEGDLDACNFAFHDQLDKPNAKAMLYHRKQSGTGPRLANQLLNELGS